ncbi:MAG: hypothetical protein NTU49_01020 [Gammaproteobacteria bacterium]|nr:hypothetical protein [Gammaproteobacteria bacterium]
MTHFLFPPIITVHLRAIVFYASCATTLIVFSLLLFLSLKQKKINRSEIIWSLVPFLMLFVLLIPIVKQFLHQ